MNWIVPKSTDAIVEQLLASELSLAPFLATLLGRRGFVVAGNAETFLYPKLKLLGDPFLLPNMESAINRILAAIEGRERIVFYGDYDVDGVTSLALFTRVLR